MSIKSLSHSSLTDNLFYRSMLVGNTAYEPVLPPYELIETAVLGDNTSTEVEFTSGGVWGSYEHLQLRVSARIHYTGSATGGNIDVRVNGQASTYRNHFLRGNGSSADAGSEAGAYFNRIPYTASTAEFGSFELDLLDFNNPNKNTTYRSLGGSAHSYAKWVELSSAGWFSTTAVTSIQIRSREFTLGSGSRFSLYGLRSA